MQKKAHSFLFNVTDIDIPKPRPAGSVANKSYPSGTIVGNIMHLITRLSAVVTSLEMITPQATLPIDRKPVLKMPNMQNKSVHRTNVRIYWISSLTRPLEVNFSGD